MRRSSHTRASSVICVNSSTAWYRAYFGVYMRIIMKKRDVTCHLCHHGTEPLFFFRSHVPCQTQESCAQLHVILMFRVRFVICQGEKQRCSLEPAGRSPEDGALLSQAQESRSQSRASASIFCVPSGELTHCG